MNDNMLSKNIIIAVIFLLCRGGLVRGLCTVAGLALLGVLAPVAFAHKDVLYLSAAPRTGATPGIYRTTIDPPTGQIDEPTLAVAVEGANFLAISSDGKRVYASLGARGLAVYSVKADGSLALRDRRTTGGRAVHLWLEPKERAVLAPNFDEGTLASFLLGPQGVLGGRSDLVQFTGSGPRLPRQAHSRPHAVYTDAEGSFVYVCDLGADKVWTLQLDPTTGMLTLCNPPGAAVLPGAGPRHLAIHPNGRYIYVNNEMDPSLARFARDPVSGQLSYLDTTPILPVDVETKGVSTAEIFFHPTGRALYISNRGYDSITAFAVSESGDVRWLQNRLIPVRSARTFAISPDGRWMIAAGESGGEVVSLQIDATSMELSVTPHRTQLAGVNCVMFVPHP